MNKIQISKQNFDKKLYLCSNIKPMQTLTVTIRDDKQTTFLIELLSKFTFVENVGVSEKNANEDLQLSIIKPVGKPEIDDFAGFWENNLKTLEQIREKAWKRTS